MKNQYFGDIRDLFKYDLALKVCQELDLGFTFIPMLTAPDGRTDGNQIDYAKAKAGFNNSALLAFLSDCVKKNQRDVKQLGEFVSSMGVRYFLYYPAQKELMGILTDCFIASLVRTKDMIVDEKP